ncbi:geranylgeranyl reductase family protein [Candidatus Magnetomonas plexicatena]|uniref:geranylgeranyl reductase family protein n=1 Tax=Candidatus Magnetomonas plexicatena TaxID=2552947 RepID=UPI001C75FA09|nr:geranylgeranyl reductase family protein [Nitrospirales bacterium LBB_01]
MNRYDVHAAIVGGGPAGATAARILGLASVETVLIERNPDNDKPCGGGLISTAFKDFDIPKSLIKHKVHSLEIVSPNGVVQEIDLDGTFLSIINRREFDKTLRLEAQSTGASVITGQVTGVSFNKGVILLKISHNGNETILRAKYVIAADGVNSFMRKAVTGTFPKRVFTAHEIIQGGSVPACRFQFGGQYAPEFYAWVFPHSDGISVGTGTKDTTSVNRYLDNFIKDSGFEKTSKRRGYFIPVWDGGIYYKSGVFFVGDSAGQVLPMTYEGIYYAMKSAKLAADAIIHNKPNNYKKHWQSKYKKHFILMRALQNYFLKTDETAEKLVSLHNRADVREASLGLWTQKNMKLKELTTLTTKLLKRYLFS